MKITQPLKLATLSDRLNHALELTGTRKADLAKAIEVKPQIIQFLCGSSTVSSRFTFEIATALGLNTRWLATGEGEMFLADDPKQKILKAYTPVPFVNLENLPPEIVNGNLSQIQTNEYRLIRSTEKNIFCLAMPDISMEPLIYKDALIFFASIQDGYKLQNNDLVLAYLPHYNTTLIRQVTTESNNLILAPMNSNLFKKIELNEEIKVLAIAVEYHWKIRRK